MGRPRTPLLVGLATVLALLSASARGRAEGLDVLVKGEFESPWADHATSTVGKRELEERLPRSSPDALRYEPGVFVQQTGHGQGSAFIRGRTGQQTVLLFDGIRLNNSTWRQGPNQYLFTVDAHSIRSLSVMRGPASTLYGSDAIGGVIHAHPLEPTWDPDAPSAYLRPRAFLRWATADSEFAERVSVDAQLDPLLALVGVGFRRVGALESGGPVRSPTTGAIPQVPAFEDDGRTQLGTGFKELTTDTRLVYRLGEERRLVAAAYLYRQYDAPRTDQCPPPFASRTECLRYLEQFRTLAYVAYEGRSGALPWTRIALSYQRQHELRRRERPRSFVEELGRDDVDTFGLTATTETAATALFAKWLGKGSFGADWYQDRVHSASWIRFTDLEYVRQYSRGQYLAGSSFGQGGAFAVLEAASPDRLALRGGGRGGVATVSAPGDPESATRAIARTWGTWSAFGQLEWRPAASVSFTGTVDRSYRVPNLDDLTSRQQAGPGFQFENPALAPERALTFELGTRVSLPGAETSLDGLQLQAEAWVFHARLDDAITRSTRSALDCPASTPQCGASWYRYQLVNAPGTSVIDGAELSLRLRALRRLVVRANVAWAWGEGPNPQGQPADPAAPYEARVPLSRVAPLNGSVDARLGLDRGIYLGASLRWALAQTRLAISDRSDARIPEGGTPGFAVVDLRAGFRVDRRFLVAVVAENVGDAAYRYHGSSINGPGRGLIVSLESGL